SDEGMYARIFSALQRGDRALDVAARGASQRRDAGLGKLAHDGSHGRVIAFGSDGKSGLKNIDAEVDQFGGHPHFFGNGHATARRLLAVAQRRVEYIYSLFHDVLLTYNRAMKCPLSFFDPMFAKLPSIIPSGRRRGASVPAATRRPGRTSLLLKYFRKRRP